MSKGLDLHYFNVEQAFVQPEIDEEVFMRMQPACGNLTGRVVQSNKIVHGIKQAARPWYSFLNSKLQAYDFEEHKSEQCFLRLLDTKTGDMRMLLGVYDDDMTVAGNSEDCQ